MVLQDMVPHLMLAAQRALVNLEELQRSKATERENLLTGHS